MALGIEQSPEQHGSHFDVGLDSQTGLLNKASFYLLTENTVEEANASGGPLALIFIDVNYFKDINDNLGHDEGDVVISEIGEVIAGLIKGKLRTESKMRDRPLDFIALNKHTARPEDIEFVDHIKKDIDIGIEAGHIGGDEFAVLCKTNAYGATLVEDRLRKALAEYLVQPGKENLRRIGIGFSIGVGIHEQGETSRELLKKADEAMYEDKLKQLPDLTPGQEQAIRAVTFILKSQGIRSRDVPQYLKIMSR